MIQSVKEHPEWKIIYEKYRDADYGIFISHNELESDLGMSRGNKYYLAVNRWRKEMLNKIGKQIECENNKGYRVIEPKDYRHSAIGQLEKGKRRIRRGAKIMENTPYERLGDEERSKHMIVAAGIKQLVHFSKQAVFKIKQIDKKVDQLRLDIGRTLDVAD